MELADFIVVSESLWNSQESRLYKKGETIRLPASTKTGPESSVQPAQEAEKRRGRPPKSE